MKLVTYKSCADAFCNPYLFKLISQTEGGLALESYTVRTNGTERRQRREEKGQKYREIGILQLKPPYFCYSHLNLQFRTESLLQVL